jgi:mannose-6-phosphate isomerase-like protein (cupin superfamily)
MATIASDSRSIYNPIQRDRVTFVETAAESGGRRTLVEVELEPRGGNGLHFHTRFTERFRVVSGTLGVQLGSQELHLRPGEEALVERNIVHRFFNPTDQTTIFTTELEPGDAGFEQGLMIAYGLATDGRTNDGMPKNLLELALIVELTGTRLPGAMGLVLNPAFSRLAALARRRGVERRLVTQYVRSF